MGVLSIQGPNSRKILQNITKFDLSDESLPVNSATIAAININGRGKVLRKNFATKILRGSSVRINYRDQFFNPI